MVSFILDESEINPQMIVAYISKIKLNRDKEVKFCD